MGGAERIVLAFGALGETGEAAALAQAQHAVAPAGENFVRIRLVAHIPDQPVMWRVEDVMECQGQFDHAQTGAEMTAGNGDGADGFVAQFRRQLCQLVLRQSAQVLGTVDKIQNRRCTVFCQCPNPSLALDNGAIDLPPLRRHFGPGARSVSPVDHEPRQRTERVGAVGKNVKMLHRLLGQHLRLGTRALQHPARIRRWPYQPRYPCRFVCPPTVLSPSTSSKSSTIWKARPRSWA